MRFHDSHPEYIPGSDYIFVSQYEDGADLKRDGDIVLMPQPTDSVNDPLSWPKYRKLVQLIIVIFLRGVTCAVADDGFSILQTITKDYPNFDLNSFNTSTGVLFAGIGGWALFNAPSAYLYGVRISYIVSCVFGIIGNILYARVSSPGMLLASQFFTGAATSVGESVALLSFAQLCYQHQINDVIGIYVVTTASATFAGPLIDGYVAQNLGWHWVGYMGLIFEFVVLLMVVFGLLETSFDRHLYEKDNSVINGVAVNEMDRQVSKTASVKMSVRPAGSETSSASRGSPQEQDYEARAPLRQTPKTYRELIRPITPATNIQGWGFIQYVKRLVLLCRVFAFPPVIFSGLQWATQIGMITVYKDLENEYWAKSPWNYSSGPLAMMMIPNLIGSIIGGAYSTWFADWFVKWRARRNGGLREAEVRLWVILPALILDPLGMFLFGAGTEYQWAWYAPYVALGFVGFGFGVAGEVSISYMADCYPEMVLEGMVGIVMIYTMSSLVISFVATYWTELSAMNTMISVGVLKFGIMALMFPMMFWGKRCRKMTRRMYFSFIERRDSLNRD